MVEGVSFGKGMHSFKGSQIDRKYGYKGLMRILEQNRQIAERERINHRIPLTLGGVKLTPEQRLALDGGKAVWMAGLTDRSGKVHDCYVKYSDEKEGLAYYRRDPDAEQQQSEYSSIGAGLGLFDLPGDGGGEDLEEEAFHRMQQQRKKKRRGMRM